MKLNKIYHNCALGNKVLVSSTYIWLILVIDFGWTVLSNKGHIWDSVKLGGKNCKNGWSAG